jgi:glutamyl-tRNA synthetase
MASQVPFTVSSYVHVPLIIKEDGRKMSKRSGDPSFEDLLEAGYLVEAVVNYVTLLGWSPGSNEEFFSLEELCRSFDIKGISKSPAVFDINKLNWMNGEYIRKMSLEDFHKAALPHYKGVIKNPDIDLIKVSRIMQPRTEVLNTIPNNIDFFDRLPDYDIELYVHKKMKTTIEGSLENLKTALPVLEAVDDWNEQNIHDKLMEIVQQLGIKNGQMFWPIRTAVTGKAVSPGGAIEVAEILGKDETIKRIKTGIEKLSGQAC